MRIVPDNGLVQASIGACYKRLGDEQAYKQQIEMALAKLSPEWEKRETLYNRACFYTICGKAETALKLLASAQREKQLTPALAWSDIDFELLWDDPRLEQLIGLRPS